MNFVVVTDREHDARGLRIRQPDLTACSSAVSSSKKGSVALARVGLLAPRYPAAHLGDGPREAEGHRPGVSVAPQYLSTEGTSGVRLLQLDCCISGDWPDE